MADRIAIEVFENASQARQAGHQEYQWNSATSLYSSHCLFPLTVARNTTYLWEKTPRQASLYSDSFEYEWQLCDLE